MTTLARIARAFLLAAALAGCGSMSGLERDVSPSQPLPTRFVESVPGERVRLLEAGPHGPLRPDGPTVVFVHGIPSSLYLWRNVLPIAAVDARAAAFDLPGYGESDLPADGDYTYSALAERTDAVLDRLARESAGGQLVLVVNDLGSVLALDWAARHPDRVAGLVFAEAIFMPAQAWYDQTTLLQQGFFFAFGSGAVARHMTVRTGLLYRNLLRLGAERDLSERERETYLRPYAAGRDGEDGAPADWRERRRVVLDGPGPATTLDGGLHDDPPRHPDDVVGVLNRTAAALDAMDEVPMLLVHAEPGFISNREALDYARDHFDQLTVTHVRAGHFIPEDQPTDLGVAVLAWYRRAVLGQTAPSAP